VFVKPGRVEAEGSRNGPRNETIFGKISRFRQIIAGSVFSRLTRLKSRVSLIFLVLITCSLESQQMSAKVDSQCCMNKI
jgi:hypothetical protein